MNIRKRRYTCGLMLAASVLCYLPACAWAQSAPAKADDAAGLKAKITAGHDAANDGDPTVVTIFGHRLTTEERGRTRIDTKSAGSCAFSGGGVADFDGNLKTDDWQDAQKAMLADDPNDATTDEPHTFRDNSPSGNVSQPEAGNMSTLPNMRVFNGGELARPVRLPDCQPGDLRFMAGRNYIARNDKSLSQAYAAFDAKDYPKALTLFKKAYSIVGYPESALMVGKIYLYGLGTPRNTADAIVWLNKSYDYAASAMNKGVVQKFNPADPEAMTARTDAAMTLARIYMVGWDVPKDPARARSWYAKADGLGYIPATHLLGQAARNGYGCPKNITQAVSYFKRAGQSGYAPAQYALGVIYYTGEDTIAQDKTLAGAWLVAASKHGHAGALYAVGRMYDLGETVPADPKRALVYYKEAAVKGNADAENALALYFYTGELVPKDAVMARKLFQQSARQGLPDAMFNLAVMYANGEGGPKDMALAYVWMTLAADSGLEKANDALAEISAKLTPDEHARAEALLNPPKA